MPRITADAFPPEVIVPYQLGVVAFTAYFYFRHGNEPDPYKMRLFCSVMAAFWWPAYVIALPFRLVHFFWKNLGRPKSITA